MDTILQMLAASIDLNKDQAYLHIEQTKAYFKLWVVERGTGGCTFPSMELLVEKTTDEKFDMETAFKSDCFLKEILQARESIKNDNPYFYNDVFLST